MLLFTRALTKICLFLSENIYSEWFGMKSDLNYMQKCHAINKHIFAYTDISNPHFPIPRDSEFSACTDNLRLFMFNCPSGSGNAIYTSGLRPSDTVAVTNVFFYFQFFTLEV